jgi:hypothetical protein
MNLKKVDQKIYEKRIANCKGCKSVRNTIGVGLTCGVFLLPNFIPKTCGCKLSWKAKLQDHDCPQEKW